LAISRRLPVFFTSFLVFFCPTWSSSPSSSPVPQISSSSLSSLFVSFFSPSSRADSSVLPRHTCRLRLTPAHRCAACSPRRAVRRARRGCWVAGPGERGGGAPGPAGERLARHDDPRRFRERLVPQVAAGMGVTGDLQDVFDLVPDLAIRPLGPAPQVEVRLDDLEPAILAQREPPDHGAGRGEEPVVATLLG